MSRPRQLMYHIAYRELECGNWTHWRVFTGFYTKEAEAKVEAERYLHMRSAMGINTEVILVTMVHFVDEVIA